VKKAAIAAISGQQQADADLLRETVKTMVSSAFRLMVRSSGLAELKAAGRS